MAKKSSKNNDLLKDVKNTTSPQIYKLLGDLVNRGREDLAEAVLKVDYLLTYANSSIKQKDKAAAKEALDSAKVRMDKLKKEDVDTSHLEDIMNRVITRK